MSVDKKTAESAVTGQNKLGERIGAALAERGAKQRACEEYGVSQQALGVVINGEVKKTRFLPQISKCLDIPLTELESLRDEDLRAAGKSVKGNIPQGARDAVAQYSETWRPPISGSFLPICGFAAASGKDMVIFSNNDVNEQIPMPSSLENVDGAYGIEIVGASMQPRYFPREVVHVNPHKTHHPDDFVVLHVRDHVTGQLCGFVKQFKKETGGKVIVRQFNPPKTLRFNRDDVEGIHVIIGSQRR